MPLIERVGVNRKARTTTAYTPILPLARQHYLGYEAVAVGLGLFAPIAVPDIFQTAHFAATLDTVFHPDRTEDEHALAARLRRERAAYLLGQYGPPLQVVIDEGALHRPESGPDPSGAGGQYAELRMIIHGLKRLNTSGRQHLADGELNPDIAIRIAPFSSGTYFGSTHARSIVRLADRPYAAAYADTFGHHTSFDTALGGPTEEQRIFERLWANLPGPEHTNDVLDALLASLPV